MDSMPLSCGRLKTKARIARLLPLVLMAVGCEPKPASTGVFDISKLEGRWEFFHDSTHEIAEWNKSEDGIRGTGYVLYGPDTSFFEFLRISKSEGQLVYHASLFRDRKEEIGFPMINQSDNRVEFFNAANGFPQRVVYELTNDSSLLVYIEGLEAGRMVRKNFIYEKK